jgi:bifunctional non-homologous end joining protein LigD
MSASALLALGSFNVVGWNEPGAGENCFGSSLEQSRVHELRSAVVLEVRYLTWTEANLLRAVSYQGPRNTSRPSE